MAAACGTMTFSRTHFYVSDGMDEHFARASFLWCQSPDTDVLFLFFSRFRMLSPMDCFFFYRLKKGLVTRGYTGNR